MQSTGLPPRCGSGSQLLVTLGYMKTPQRMSNELPILGVPLDSSTKQAKLARLRQITGPILSSKISDAVPISCRVQGHEASLEDLPHLVENDVRIVVYFENYDYAVISTWVEFVAFFAAREP